MKGKKILTILLSLSIMLTFMPTMAFADDATPNEGWNTDHTKYFYTLDGENYISAAVTSEKTAPTCGVAGDVIYTAKDADGNVLDTFTDKGKGDPATGKHTAGQTVKEPVKGKDAIVEATCITDGEHDDVVYCTVCNQELSRKTVVDKATGHTEAKEGDEGYVVDGGDCTTYPTITIYCTKCGEKLRVETGTEYGHKWDEGKVTKEATCTEAGEKTFTCTVEGCKATKTEPIEAKGHVWKVGKDNDTAAKCGEAGSYEEFEYCEVCGVEKEGSRHTVETEALEHDWDAWKVVSEAKTCGEKTVSERVCKRCGEKEVKEEQTVDHSWSDEKQLLRDKTFIKATCLHEGQHTEAYVCTKCGAVDEESKTLVEDGIGEHVWEVTKTSKAPTCTATGIGDRKCTVCGREEQDAVLEMIPHTAGEPVKENIHDATCEDDGSFDLNVYCTECKAAMPELSKHIEVPAFGHDYKKVDAKSKAPTCTAAGYDYMECTHDASHNYKVDLEALGHDWEERSYTAPTCTKAGSRAMKCKVCGEISTEDIAALDHSKLKKTTAFENLKNCVIAEDGSVVSNFCKDGTYDEVVYCECGNKISTTKKTVKAAKEHKWNYKYVTEPDCVNKVNGTASERKCADCGDVQYYNGTAWVSEKPATPSVVEIEWAHNWELIDKIEPECLKDGKATYKCSVCGEHMTEVIDQLGHNETAKKIAAEVDWDATTTADKAVGYVTYTWLCSNGVHKTTTGEKFSVNATEDGVIDGKPYTIKPTVTPATCKDGKVVYTFAEGDLEVKNATFEVVIPAELDKDGKPVNHVWGDPEESNRVEPTCTEKGHYDIVRVCEVCGEKKTEGDTVYLDPLGHEYFNFEDGKPVYDWHKVEGSEVEGNCVNDWTHEEGLFCLRCGELNKDTKELVVDKAAKGHTAGKAVKENEIEATCYEKGSYDNVVYCTVCNEELSREKVEVPESHFWKAQLDPEASKAATCVDAGFDAYSFVCDHCGMVLNENSVEDYYDYTWVIENAVAAAGLGEFNDDYIVGDHYNIPVKATGVHTPETVRENETATTYDKVVKCSVCGFEISRETVPQESYEEAMEDAQDALEAADEIDDSYPADSVAAVKAAKDELQALLDAGETDPAKIETAVNKLYDAIDAAEAAKEAEEADAAKQHAKAEAEAEETLSEADKIDTTAFSGDDQQAIKDAKVALRTALKTGATTEELKAATKAVNDAIATAKENKAAVDKANVAAAEITTENKYTDDSVKAVAAAKAALDTAVQGGKNAEIKKAVEDLNKAVAEAKLKAKNTLKASGKTLKASAKRTKKFSKRKSFKISGAKGKVTFKKVSGSKKISVSKAGKVTVKKGLKKGKTYKVKVKVTAAGNGDYLKGTKTVTLKIKVK